MSNSMYCHAHAPPAASFTQLQEDLISKESAMASKAKSAMEKGQPPAPAPPPPMAGQEQVCRVPLQLLMAALMVFWLTQRTQEP